MNSTFNGMMVSQSHLAMTETQFEVIPNLRYYNWIKEMKYGEDGPETYEYDQGIAP